MTRSTTDWLLATRDRLANTPALRIAELNDGPACVQGIAQALQPLTSPLSGIGTIGYRIVLHVELASGPRVVDVTRMRDFWLDDGADRVRVVAANCELILQHEYTQQADQGAGSAEFLALRLLAENVPPQDMHGKVSVRRWHEYFLQAGERTTVCGHCRMVVDPNARAVSYRENAATPTLVAPADETQIVADLPHAELSRYLADWQRRATAGR